MNESGVAIRYGDVAPEAKENFIPSASEQESFVDLAQLQQYNLDFPNYGNPCEKYSVVLDGTAQAFPSNPEDVNLGLWSKQISDDDGVFAEPIVLTLTADGQYSSQGITLTFDKYNGIFANSVNIVWYRDLEILSEMDFVPDSASYFCRNKVENYNKVRITFRSLNMPKNRLKLRVVDYGYGTYFYGNELRSVKMIQEINPLSSEIAINTCDFTLDSKTDMDYSFQSRQPLSVYFNGKLKATTFVKSAKRQAKRLWQVQSEDYVGLMDSVMFKGGVYVDKDAVELLTEIFTVAKIPFSIADGVIGTVSGYIPYTTCRNALMQVAFAIGTVVDTSNSETVDVYLLDDAVTQTIPLERIMQGQSFTDEDTVTSVEVTSHSYTPIEETLEVYKASENGAGEEIFVSFSEPLHSLSISSGVIKEQGANYAIIDAYAECVLTGKKYEHSTSVRIKKNPVVLASELEKIVAVQNATLVSSSNADSVLERCYDWLTRVNATNLKIVEGKHVFGGEIPRYDTGVVYDTGLKYDAATPRVVTYDQPVAVGDMIEAETEYLGVVKGRVIKQTFNLNGGIIIKETEMR